MADLKYALRMLIKRPGTTVLAIIALALGIGLTATMFSIVQGVILRGLPFDESEKILYVGRVNTTQPGRPGSTSLHDFVDWRTSQTSFDLLGVFTQTTRVVTGGLAPERYRGALVTPNAFRILRVAPVLGRDFVEADSAPGAPQVALLSYRVWKSQFEGRPSVINETVRVNGLPTTIIGVMPEKFGFPETQDFWQPLELKLAPKRGEGTFVNVMGRLKAGVSIERAQTEFAAIAKNLATQYKENENQGVQIIKLIDRFIPGEIYTTLMSMLGAVFGVMLIACANVTNLQLARAAERTKEVALRTTLGASRGRIIRQMLVEGVLLAGAGAMIGLGIAKVGVGFFNRSIVDTNPPFFIDIRIDWVVLAFAMALTGVAAIVSSLLPALRATKLNLNTVLKDEGRANTGISMGRFSRWLVVAEVLLSCVLLVVSGMMIKSIVLSGRTTYPFPVSEIFVAGLNLDAKKYPTDADLLQMYDRIEPRLRSVPGVRALALTTGSPGAAGGATLGVEGRVYESDKAYPTVGRMSVTPGFFDVVHSAPIRGRLLKTTDAAGAERVAVIDDLLQARHFPNEDPIGRRVRLGTTDKAPWVTIVGVVPSLAAVERRELGAETIYLPLTQNATNGPTLLAASTGDPLQLTAPLRRAVLEVDPDIPLAQPNSLAANYARNGWRFRVFGGLFLSFGVAALLLASAGLYGVMSFGVRRRTQEIGVRMALGATRKAVVTMILWQGIWRVGLGIALGLLPAWGLANLMTALFYNTVTPTDVTSYAVTVVVLGLSGFCASVVPALRAASVDPLVALRN